jgi:hypothetical protein
MSGGEGLPERHMLFAGPLNTRTGLCMVTISFARRAVQAA